jgi:hypothetical protein
MLKCIESEKLITEAAESGFRFVEAELFEHLKRCERCAAELKGIKKLRAAFESAPRYDAPHGMTERVMRRIHCGTHTRPHSIPLSNLAAGLALFFALGAGVLSGTFLASSIMGDGAGQARVTGARGTLLAYSADTLDPASTDIVTGDYLTAGEDSNER